MKKNLVIVHRIALFIHTIATFDCCWSKKALHKIVIQLNSYFDCYFETLEVKKDIFQLWLY